MPDDLSLDLFPDAQDDTAPSGRPSGSREDPAGERETEPVQEERPRQAAQPPKEAGREADGPRVWSVSQVNRAVRGMLESNVEPLWVGGEIGGWTRSRAGHCYFTLKDDRAQIRAVMFQREAQGLPTDPDEGMQVRTLGQLTLYEARGEYQLVVRRLEAEGTEGLWRLAFEKLRSRLEAEGLLDEARKRRLPRYPETVGVVTSPTGAALRDIISVLRRRAPWARLLVSGTRVQGEGASVEIAEALDRLAATGLCEVILVSRGGGSIEDLWAFNEEPVARAVAACPVPVVSAVGHEVDVTICDLVADLRAPTPSAGAEAVVPDAAVVLEALRRTPERLARGLRGVATRRRERIEHRLERLARAMERRLGPARQSVDLASAGLDRGVRGVLDRRRRALEGAAGRLEALSPLATLARGYSVARDGRGRVLRSVEDFEVNETFEVTVGDGRVVARTMEIRREREPNG